MIQPNQTRICVGIRWCPTPAVSEVVEHRSSARQPALRASSAIPPHPNRHAVAFHDRLSEALEEERSLGPLVVCEENEGGRRLLPRTTGEIRPVRRVVREYARRPVELSGGNRTAAAQALHA